MEGIAVDYFSSSFDPGNNKDKSEFHSYISDNNEQDACDPHAYMVYLLIILESGALVTLRSIVW